jgi:hypothetical protein
MDTAAAISVMLKLRILQYLSQAQNGIEIGRENNLAGELLGDICQHFKALCL